MEQINKAFIQKLIIKNQVNEYVLIDFNIGYNTKEVLFLNQKSNEFFNYSENQENINLEKLDIPEDKLYYNIICSVN